MKNILKVVFVIIGTLIGAGFASGQEIYSFFFAYGIKGIFGIIISSAIIGIVINRILYICQKRDIKNYKDFLDFIMSNNQKTHFNTKNIINTVINIFILITFFIMIAGSGAYFEQELGINSLQGSIFLSSICFIVFMTNVKGVIKVNEIIVPILIIVLLGIGIFAIKDINIFQINKYVNETSNGNWLIKSILYASYNSILLIPILITLKDYVKSKNEINKTAIITTGIIIILSLSIYFLLMKVNVDITKLEMPVVYVVSNISKSLKNIYGFIILMSIFTTSISLGISFLENVSKTMREYKIVAVLICFVSIIVSNFGFSNLISLLYPIFGFLGMVQLGTVLLRTKMS